MIKKLFLFIILLYISLQAFAQDPQFSQFFNTPLVMNPAFTGTSECYRAGLSARTQWTGMKRPFNTSLVYLDYNYADYNSGLGIMFLYDDVGVSRQSSKEISFLYSYHVPLSAKYHLRFGTQATYVSRNINYSQLIFEDQFTGIDLTDDYTSDPITGYTNNNYFDFSAGLLFFKDDKFWAGASAHHLTRPNQAFYIEDENSRLPIKYSLHAGFKFSKVFKTMTNTTTLTIFPAVLYKSEVKFDQLDMGVYAYLDNIMAGVFYRGLLVKQEKGIRNNDAIVLHGGFRLNAWQFAYSYDITTSKLGVGNTHGSHEISIIYKFCMDFPPQKKPHKKHRSLPCPNFD